jgi:hypothetical protein
VRSAIAESSDQYGQMTVRRDGVNIDLKKAIVMEFATDVNLQKSHVMHAA